MLTEVSKEEAIASLCLGDISFGLIIQTKNYGIIFENLKIKNNSCYYYDQTNSVLETWYLNKHSLDIAPKILSLTPQYCSPDWVEILKIYIIGEV